MSASLILSTQVSPEYTWYTDSTERKNDGPDSANPTNDVVIQTQMPRSRMPVTQINLGSFEIPLVQYTIESLWNKLYFTEGIKLTAETLTETSIREFPIQVNNSVYTAELPLYLNPIIAVDFTDPTTPIFTTEFNHALDLRGQWTFTDSIQLIGTELTPTTNGDLVNLTADNPNLTVLNEQQFSLSNVPPATTWSNPNGAFGYVYAPPITTPEVLARIVTAALDLVLPGAFEVTYNAATGQYTLCSLSTIATCRTLDNPLNTTDLIYIIITTQNSLPAIMGFGTGTVIVPINYTYAPGVVSNTTYFGAFSNQVPDNCAATASCVNVCLTGGYGSQCCSSIQIEPGNYTGSTLATELQLEWNRLYFDPGETAAPADRANFVFSDASGTVYTLPIEYGLYTPDQFAQYLQDGMNTLDVTGGYEVVYNATTHQFCFSRSNGFDFGLEFGLGIDTVFFRIGFDAVPYRGKSEYCSVHEVIFPTKTCCGTDSIPLQYQSYLYAPQLNTATSIFTINAYKPTCLSVVVTDNAPGLLTVTTNPPAPALIAHGYQVGDVVDIIIPAVSADAFKLTVVEVTDAFTFVVDTSSASSVITGLVNSPASVCLDGTVPSTLYFNSSKPNSLPASYLGFAAQDPGGISPFVGDFVYDLSGPPYLLLVVKTPKGATHNNHYTSVSTTSIGNIPDVFAKIILFSQFKVERLLSFTMYVPQSIDITDMHFIILNPDHTPYQLHGRNWSASIIFTVAENTSADLLVK